MFPFAFLLTSALILSIASGIPGPVFFSRDVIFSGETLEPDETLENWKCMLKMQKDCNLVIYENGNPKWASQTANGGTNCNLLMQFDGNLVLYDGNGKALWQSNTSKGVMMTFASVLQSDCTLSVFERIQWVAVHNNA